MNKKKPFGYRIIHQNSLMSCPGQVALLSFYVYVSVMSFGLAMFKSMSF